MGGDARDETGKGGAEAAFDWKPKMSSAEVMFTASARAGRRRPLCCYTLLPDCPTADSQLLSQTEPLPGSGTEAPVCLDSGSYTKVNKTTG